MLDTVFIALSQPDTCEYISLHKAISQATKLKMERLKDDLLSGVANHTQNSAACTTVINGKRCLGFERELLGEHSFFSFEVKLISSLYGG